MVRREWRQQALVLGLLTLAVTAAISVASAAYNLAPVAGNAELGSVNHSIGLQVPDEASMDANLAAASDWFGSIEVIGRQYVPAPGVFEPVEYRAQDPDGPYSGPMLGLRSGRYPGAAEEVAVTDGLTDLFELEVGSTFALDGMARTVVGVVENSSDFDDEFALVSPSSADLPDEVTILVDASGERVEAFRPPASNDRQVSIRPSNEGALAALSVFAGAAVVLLLVALVAAASFVVIAQRRLRQLGMLAAIGATTKQLRLVMIANGAVIGAAAAVIGAVAGVGGWIVIAPRLEAAVGHRIDRLNVPWWLVLTGIVLAVTFATAAGWWPARAVARTSVVRALSGRPSPPVPVRRSAAVSVAFLVIGLGSLSLMGDLADDESVKWSNLALAAIGILATVFGVLLIGPLAIRALARCGARLPIAMRLPLRDLARYQSRSGAALAAITLVLGIPAAIAISSSAAAVGAGEGNLAANQLLIRFVEFDGPFVPDTESIEALEAGVDGIAAMLDDPRVTSLDVARDPGVVADGSYPGQLGITIGVRSGDGWRDLSLLYVATPELLGGQSVAAGTDVLTAETGELRYFGVQSETGEAGRSPEAVTNSEPIEPAYSSLPASLITADAMQERGWVAVPSGRWLIETSSPIAPDQLRAVVGRAAGAGLTVESRDTRAGLVTLRWGGTAAGVVLALAILAMTVGLLRGEAENDLRTLTATGATSFARRTLTAATAGGLALLGAVLGTAGAYAALTASHAGGVSLALGANLAVMAIGTPLLAAAGGWLLAGREPTGIARQPIT